MESKREKAMALFKEGYNCSQAVFAAYAEDYGMDQELALRLAASFGGGMGRMREVCGAFSGMLLVAGLETGATEGKDVDGKKANYDLVQRLGNIFKEKNGSLYCRELLGLVPMGSTGMNQAHNFQDTTPQKRTDEYYKKRPCVELVGLACDILDEQLFRKKETI